VVSNNSDAIPKRFLGRTDIRISPIGLGTWQFSEGQGLHRFTWSKLNTQVTNDVVKAALDGGINWFDTASSYGDGRSERGLARALQAAGKVRGDVVIADKWWPVCKTARSIESTIDDRLRNVEPYGIDLYQIHWPFSFSSIESQMDAMAGQVESGRIRAVGVSNFSAAQMRRAHDALARRGIPLASNQVRYNLLARKVETRGVLDAAVELGITIICYMPLEMGLLTGKFHAEPAGLRSRPAFRRQVMKRMLKRSMPVIEVLGQIASDRGATVAQVALNWLVNSRGQTVVAIPGATSPQQTEHNAAAMKLALTPDEMERIDRVSRQFR